MKAPPDDPAAQIQRALDIAYKQGRRVDEATAEEDENGVVTVYVHGVPTMQMHRTVFDQMMARFGSTSAKPEDT